MERLNFRIEGASPLLTNNPQTVDPFNPYTRDIKVITSKRKKVDEDLLELRRLEVESKLYFDDALGIYVPSTWISAAIAGCSWNKAKIKKAEIRSAVFPVDDRIKLSYRGMERVAAKRDISGNEEFTTVMLLKQGQVKIAKAAPIFREWSFETAAEYDPAIIDKSSLVQLLSYAAGYSGWGDFRPTYGRSVFVEVK